MFTCEFNTSTSVRPDLFPDLCGDEAEFLHAGESLCRQHWFIETGRIVICNLCGNITSESEYALTYNHSRTCSLWLQGVDCMHNEDRSICCCEEEANFKLREQSLQN